MKLKLFRKVLLRIFSSFFLSVLLVDFIVRFATMVLKALVTMCFLAVLPSRKKVRGRGRERERGDNTLHPVHILKYHTHH